VVCPRHVDLCEWRTILEVQSNWWEHFFEGAPWWKVGDMRLLVVNRDDPVRGRLDIEYTHIANGQVDTRHGSHRAYTYRQLVELLEGAGFTVQSAEPWTRQAHNVSFIATRV
jgi:hypothetical protein